MGVSRENLTPVRLELPLPVARRLAAVLLNRAVGHPCPTAKDNVNGGVGRVGHLEHLRVGRPCRHGPNARLVDEGPAARKEDVQVEERGKVVSRGGGEELDAALGQRHVVVGAKVGLGQPFKGRSDRRVRQARRVGGLEAPRLAQVQASSCATVREPNRLD